jgi:hypothetical protein
MRRENLEGLQTRERRRRQIFDRTPGSSRHGGARGFLGFKITDPPRDVPSSHSKDRFEENSSD